MKNKDKVHVAEVRLRRAAFMFATHEPEDGDDNDKRGQRRNRDLLAAALRYAAAVEATR
jgi:hypothetical protein